MTTTSTEPAFTALAGLNTNNRMTNSDIGRDSSKLIAFYLPQYHRVPENSEWWGPGFTEWTNVVRGKPNFEGHYQPHLPRDLGFYDLTYPDVMHEQAEMAKLYGLHGFCFYYYWFSGRRILERPLDNFLKSDIDINFCLCWANENWTRTWDGDTKSILLEQKYELGDEERFIDSLIPFFTDSRYIRVDDKPMLVVYRIKELPDPSLSVQKWRAAALKAGLPGLHIAVVDFYDISSPLEVNADALVEFPPHKFNGPQSIPDRVPDFTNPDFAGGVVDYSKVIAQSALRRPPSFQLYRGIMPNWDNTARRQNTPTIIVNSQPTLFGEWLRYLRAYTRENHSSDTGNFIFINAWNEWGEGCHLEPDQRWGMQYLEETLRSAFYTKGGETLDQTREKLLHNAAKALINARKVNNSELDDTIAVQHLLESLSSYQPMSDLAQKIAMRLRRSPFFYRVARFVYRLSLHVRT